MFIEVLKGTTNTVEHNKETGKVKKTFYEGNGIGRPLFNRVIAEAQSMKMIQLTPELFDFTDRTITMSYLEGEKQIDNFVDQYPECLQQSVYTEAGKALRVFHNSIRRKLPESYHDSHAWKTYQFLGKNSEALTRHGINPITFLSFLEDSYCEEEVEKSGLTWTHGDYWLNNLIGKQNGTKFDPTGVIDWELAGMGSPYEDFAVVRVSIEDTHPNSSESFWKGYADKPSKRLIQHFAFVKVLDWMIHDDPALNGDYSSDFYQNIFAKIKEIL
ncbi:hypothetical protein A3D77_01740 [Candidatus Gottesmanbacteria bacterium RIFCSPHIGHO2_02_FULL_39_11]|uniref:Aminoglycoside phosphotransferase domain-containing protein n=1 Tax=Candidatus Gottesmanbacteria bacterium RIFCSPHIGHO2_02_FULL_39_11 TaxID=1798382 RepID=A0A1F5ZUH7_9BACT|nr:MAG: hypothetical protein A3D77_01740 [Candidatus Gottesmanbacteria bacterium RIFCSPHIGHO2_02_FULL_39_11]